jgi:hypothetical protein
MITYAEKVRRLESLAASSERDYTFAVHAAAARGAQPPPVRHKCFISYHSVDIDGVTKFIEDFNQVFIPRVIGVSDSDHFKDPIGSEDEEYIKSQIRAKYLSDSTVTILYVGSCAWARKYVDWELSSSLRNTSVSKRNGLMAITPADKSTNKLPDRFRDNCSEDGGKYARYYYYPTTESSLRDQIEDAFKARNARSDLVNNSRALRKNNSACSA